MPPCTSSAPFFFPFKLLSRWERKAAKGKFGHECLSVFVACKIPPGNHGERWSGVMCVGRRLPKEGGIVTGQAGLSIFFDSLLSHTGQDFIDTTPRSWASYPQSITHFPLLVYRSWPECALTSYVKAITIISRPKRQFENREHCPQKKVCFTSVEREPGERTTTRCVVQLWGVVAQIYRKGRLDLSTIVICRPAEKVPRRTLTFHIFVLDMRKRKSSCFLWAEVRTRGKLIILIVDKRWA